MVCDSKILYLCSRLLKKGIPEAIPGSGFFTAFYQYHKDNPDCRIFLLGAMEGVAQKAMERINASVGREIVVGAMCPSYGFENKPEENELIYRTINASGANVVLVGVGAPKQEKWIFRHKSRMPGVDIWMALGATIDFEAGNVKRAPKWMQKLAMEWFYRFLMEPKRMFRRYFVDDVKFFFGISAGNCLGFIVTRLKIEMKMRKLDVVNFFARVFHFYHSNHAPCRDVGDFRDMGKSSGLWWCWSARLYPLLGIWIIPFLPS